MALFDHHMLGVRQKWSASIQAARQAPLRAIVSALAISEFAGLAGAIRSLPGNA
jgi:hypothetical protein